MKTYRLVNTAEGELPVVGDEMLWGVIPRLHRQWEPISEESLPDVISYIYENPVIRRELHPQEMAKECAKAIMEKYMIPSSRIEELILPHIQAALEGKG
jgi:hypothetical protein